MYLLTNCVSKYGTEAVDVTVHWKGLFNFAIHNVINLMNIFPDSIPEHPHFPGYPLERSIQFVQADDSFFLSGICFTMLCRLIELLEKDCF